MAEKRYVVLEGQKYTGKHRVYKAGQEFPESELFGNEENKRMSLEGAKDKIRMVKDENKKDIPGSEFVAIKGKEPKIKPISSESKKGSKK